MDIIYRIQGVEFAWNEDKAQINIEKHGVTFEEAAEVFFDPFYQLGDATANNEQRNFILGYSIAQRLLLVVYLERGSRTRIISAVQLLAQKENYMNKPDEELQLHLKPRTTETVSINIPTDTLASLKKVAASRDMTVEALLKFYIGQNLRQDLAKIFSERVLESTAQVLARHIQSEDEVLSILREIQADTIL